LIRCRAPHELDEPSPPCRAGDTAGTEKLAADLDKSYPLDTLVERYWLPTIRAAVALDPRSMDNYTESKLSRERLPATPL